MKHTLVSVFDDSKLAGEAIAELKHMGYAKDISVIAKDVNAEGIRDHQIKQDMTAEAAKGAGQGAVVGGVLGALAGGLLAGVASITVPVLGIAAIGPVVGAFTGAGAGGAAGTLVGALAQMGIPEKRAKEYQKYVESGQVLVSVTVPPKDGPKVQDVLDAYMDRQNDTRDDVEYTVYQYQYQY